jgi:hypothetical protein
MKILAVGDWGRFDARERGGLITLAPGGVRNYELEIKALESEGEIGAFSTRVEAIHAG